MLGVILDLVGYVQTPLGAVFAIATVAVFYFWAVDLRRLWSANCGAPSDLRNRRVALSIIYLRSR